MPIICFKLIASGQESFQASFYIYVLTSNIRAIWRQHKIIVTCAQTCASLLPVSQVLKSDIKTVTYNYRPSDVGSV